MFGGLRLIQRYEGCLGVAETIVESTDLLYVTLPRQINQGEECELQESIQGQRRRKNEFAFPGFRSKVDEAEGGDESQEGDRNPDEDELGQSGSNHRLQMSAPLSKVTMERR